MNQRHRQTENSALVIVDAIAIAAAFAVAYILRFRANLGVFSTGEDPWIQYLIAAVVSVPVWLVAIRQVGLYGLFEGWVRELLRVGGAIGTSALITLSLAFFYRDFEFSRGFATILIPLATAMVLIGRLCVRSLMRRRRRAGKGLCRAAIVGANRLGMHIAERLNDPTHGWDLRGFVDNRLVPGAIAHGRFRVLGTCNQLGELIAEHCLDEILIALPHTQQRQLSDVIEACYRNHIRWRMAPPLHDLFLKGIETVVAGDLPLIGVRGTRICGWKFAMKRALDFVGTLLLMVLLSPIMVAVAIAVKLSSPGPIFYRQRRVGYHGREFSMLKFRSMRENSDESIHKKYVQRYINGTAEVQGGQQKIFKLVNDSRVTTVGKWIRKSSLDELPQLFNVLAGQMSLIGPRPPLLYELDAYRATHLRRLEVLPGISGLWQVSGRNRTSFERMVELDMHYIENWSLAMDVEIFFRTISTVVFPRAA